MPVEMIRRQIQKHSCIWSKRVDELQLEAAELGNRTSFVFHRVHASDERRSDISRENGLHASRLQNMFDERCGRRFPVRTSNSDQTSFYEAVGQLDFTPNRDVFSARPLQMRFVGCHARAGNNKVLFNKGFLPMSAEFKRHSRIFQFGGRVADLGLVAGIRRGHARTTSSTKKSCGHACPRQPNDQHAFPSQLDSTWHCSFPKSIHLRMRATSTSMSSAQKAQRRAPQSKTGR